MNDKKITGNIAEKKAKHYLKKRGLSLIQCNYFTKFGEIDIIMLDYVQQIPVLVFIEVRYRANADFGTGFETVNKQKQQKIIRSAKIFLQQYPQYNNFICRFDVIGVQSDLKYTHSSKMQAIKNYLLSPKLIFEWIKDAF